MSWLPQLKLKENCIHTWKNLEVIRNSLREPAPTNLSDELVGKDNLKLKLIFS